MGKDDLDTLIEDLEELDYLDDEFDQVLTLEAERDLLDRRVKSLESDIKLLKERYMSSEDVHSAVQAVLNEESLPAALEIATEECRKVVNAEKSRFWWYDSSYNKFYDKVDLDFKKIHREEISLHRTLVGHAFKKNKVINVDTYKDLKKEIPFLMDRKRNLFNGSQINSALYLPISIYNPNTQTEEKVAVLELLNKSCMSPEIETHCAFGDEDIRALKHLTRPISSVLRNIESLDATRRTAQSTISVLVSAIEEKHKFTGSHSAKVRDYSLKLGNALNYNLRDTDILGIAAILHDIGKIGVRDAILEKTGRLTKDEYEEIKYHPQRTEKLLSKIHFTSEYKKIPSYAAAHHEKLNGKGYPHKLSGDEIKEIPRIIAIADIYDAVTSTRDYRKPMSLTEAMGAVLVSSGIGYGELDKNLVTLFLDEECFRISGGIHEKAIYTESDLFYLNNKYSIDGYSIRESYNTFKKEAMLSLDTKHSEIASTKEKFPQISNKNLIQHQIIKDYFKSMINNNKFLKPIQGKTKIKIVDLFNMMTSKYYTDKPINLSDFLFDVLPHYVQLGRFSETDARDFIQREEWRKVVRNINFNSASRLQYDEVEKSYYKRLENDDQFIFGNLNSNPDYENMIDVKRDLTSIRQIKNVHQQHLKLKELMLSMYDAKLSNFKGSFGISIDDLMTLFTDAPYQKKALNPEEFLFTIGFDYVMNGKIEKELLFDYIEKTYYLTHKTLSVRRMNSVMKKQKRSKLKSMYKYKSKINHYTSIKPMKRKLEKMLRSEVTSDISQDYEREHARNFDMVKNTYAHFVKEKYSLI